MSARMDFPGASFDVWKTTEPDYSHPDDHVTCPHGEDAPETCPACDGDEEDEYAQHAQSLAEAEDGETP
jgi:hypothetical protein